MHENMLAINAEKQHCARRKKAADAAILSIYVAGQGMLSGDDHSV
jgi:hypothetical protein